MSVVCAPVSGAVASKAVRVALLAALGEGFASAQDNVLLIVADDVGVDRVAAYGEHPSPGRTPNIDRLAANGVLFRNAWSNSRVLADARVDPQSAAPRTDAPARRSASGTSARRIREPGIRGTVASTCTPAP